MALFAKLNVKQAPADSDTEGGAAHDAEAPLPDTSVVLPEVTDAAPADLPDAPVHGAKPAMSGHGIALWKTQPGAKNDLAGTVDGERVVCRIGVGNQSGRPYMEISRVIQKGEGQAPAFEHLGYANAVNKLGENDVRPGVSRYMLLNPDARRLYITAELDADLFGKLGFEGDQTVGAPPPKKPSAGLKA